MMRLKEKVVLVSGAREGIGQAVAELFAKEGATVFAGDLAWPHDARVAGVVTLPLDVTSEFAWQRVVDTVIERCGHLDVLVNAAGTTADERLEGLATNACAMMIATNQTGVSLGMREAVGVMRRQKAGAIVNIALALGQLGADTGAVRRMSTSAALDFMEDGIRINVVLANFEACPQAHQRVFPPGAPTASQGPQRRRAAPLDVAYSCLFLASDEASCVSGAELPIAGGPLTSASASPPMSCA